MKAEQPQNEVARLAFLQSCDILDTEREEIFDDIAQMASALCGTPIAAITLIDENRQWLKSAFGFDVVETSRDVSFCAHTILQDDILVVDDASTDPRFQGNEFVISDPGVRFYAGAPLITAGHFALGSLCVIDYHARSLNEDQQRVLRILARHTTALIELRGTMRREQRLIEERARIQKELEASESGFRTVINSMHEGVTVRRADGSFVLCNPQAEAIMGLTVGQISADAALDPKWHCVGPSGESLRPEEYPPFQTLADGQTRTDEVMGVYRPVGDLRWLSVNTSLIQSPDDADPANRMVVSTFEDITDRRRHEFETSQLAAVVESSDDAILTTSLSGEITSWNSGATRLYGFTAAEMIGRQVAEMAPDAGHKQFLREAWAKLANGCTIDSFESKRYGKSGDAIDVSVRLSALRNKDGNVTGVVGVVRDIREQKAALDRLRKSEEMLADAQKLAQLGCWEIDMATGTTTWSDAMYQIAGRYQELGPMSANEYFAMVHPDDREESMAQFAEALKTGASYSAERRFVFPNGKMVWISTCTKVDIQYGKPVRVYGTIVDITERKSNERDIAAYNVALQFQMEELEAANQKLHALAVTDGLTDLANHRAFQDRLRQEFAEAKRYHEDLSIILIDVDHFKQYNDDFGHPAGDQVLKKVATLISDCARETDFVGRYGGEEFVLILPKTGIDNAVTLAERIREHIALHTWPVRPVTISAGCAELKTHIAEPGEILACADKALYESKAHGRNRVTPYGTEVIEASFVDVVAKAA